MLLEGRLDVMMKIIHTTLSDADAETLQDYCNDNHVSVSAVIKALVSDFLDTNDKDHVEHIINEAKKIKPGRPRQTY
jgi:hypothetical protein